MARRFKINRTGDGITVVPQKADEQKEAGPKYDQVREKAWAGILLNHEIEYDEWSFAVDMLVTHWAAGLLLMDWKAAKYMMDDYRAFVSEDPEDTASLNFFDALDDQTSKVAYILREKLWAYRSIAIRMGKEKAWSMTGGSFLQLKPAFQGIPIYCFNAITDALFNLREVKRKPSDNE